MCRYAFVRVRVCVCSAFVLVLVRFLGLRIDRLEKLSFPPLEPS